MCLDIYAIIDNNILNKNQFINYLQSNNLDINLQKCNIKCWISVLEYCIDEKITGKWERIIPLKTLKKWSDTSNRILEQTNIHFKMVLSQNESADYDDVKKMTLYLNICNKFNADLEFI